MAITSLRASYDTGYYPLYMQIMIFVMDPVSQGMTYFNGLQRFIPAPIEELVEDLRNCKRPGCCIGRVQARDEPPGSS